MFQYSSTYDYIPLGIKIRKQLAKRYIYQNRKGTQVKYDYVVPSNPRTLLQQANRWKIIQAVFGWKSLAEQEKQNYRDMEPFTNIMSGYNYFIQQYLKTL